MKVSKDIFNEIVSLENLVTAWEEFRINKGKKIDVQEFEFLLEQNLFSLHRDLIARRYTHAPYKGFYVRDPKVRHIHKASVRDRVLHHALFRVLNPIFEKTFIAHSFSCRVGKGTHKGVLAVEAMIRKESRNYTRQCFVLKCDVRKFFDSVDHTILIAILKKRIVDPDTMWLLEQVIQSFSAQQETLFSHQGIPIGNLTSQLFANVYMNEFDQFVKHEMKIKYYARYTDDFVVVSSNKTYLDGLIDPFTKFLEETLKLSLHPNKISIRSAGQGIDFLGYITLPHYRLVRNKTKHRIFRKLKSRVVQYRQGEIDKETLTQCLQSYLGVLSHANAHNLSNDLVNQYWFLLNE
ncbi:MAG: RNA-dependent DNA polymerase [Candidatus Spechtbacteria bacterium SB0662_bin_43]|uniref:RNA-dependent DNA polymerase n=1 Tax=Candidatus Spechtbacteria bacterium SB0662_bin_43 TaxID=2604897 RepID=A0A845DA32_9BACT|nr:RNA-dependent DNA polymerase [Candidatus Spechtbacteria bacterium SB0662_bin_43]